MKDLIFTTRGVSMVEFALILPILMLLTLGIIDFGRYFFVEHTLQFATREAVRLATVGGTLTASSGKTLDRAASIVQMIQDKASLAGMAASDLAISIYPITDTTTYSDPTGWSAIQNAGSAGDYMRVRTSYVFTFLTPFVGAFFTNGVNTISAQATYRNELF